jgi:hypothetical protein
MNRRLNRIGLPNVAVIVGAVDDESQTRVGV